MLFSILVVIFVLLIAYMHWIQGLLSGVVSMALAILAGSFAVGYHEAITTSILGGKVADSANGMMMCIIFLVVYGIGRVVFDALIPGNVRLPLYVDRVGGALCGLVAGIFAVGTVALALQMMPLGPTVAYHARYPIADDRSVTVPGRRHLEDAMVTGSLEEDLPDESKETGVAFIPADSMVLDFAAFQSQSGALAGSASLRDTHPNLLRELFFQRVGIEPAAKHSALNIGGKEDVKVVGVYAPALLQQMDGELATIRPSRKVDKVLKAEPNKIVLVVRIEVARGAVDTDQKFRFSPGMMRLLANKKDFYPVGTLHHPGNLVLSNRIDDYLLAEVDKTSDKITIDLVFFVDRADVVTDAKDELKIRPGTFLEVKRFGRVDLSDQEAAAVVPQSDKLGGMVRKKETLEVIQKRLQEGA